MYVRPPTSERHGMKLPENYSGNAFSQKPQYTDMPPPLRTQNSSRVHTNYDISHERDLSPEDAESYITPNYYNDEPQAESRITEQASFTPPAQTAPTSSIFSSLLPQGVLGNNFPFGHGIGGEELLIMAVMLMVFLSGNDNGTTDSELLLLLGLLLFAG